MLVTQRSQVHILPPLPFPATAEVEVTGPVRFAGQGL
jgi:hypothetical protein